MPTVFDAFDSLRAESPRRVLSVVSAPQEPTPKKVGLTAEQLEAKIAKLGTGVRKGGVVRDRSKRLRREEVTLHKQLQESASERRRDGNVMRCGVWNTLQCLSPGQAKPPPSFHSNASSARPDAKKWRSCRLCRDWETTEEKLDRTRGLSKPSDVRKNANTTIKWANSDLHSEGIR